MVIRVVRVTRLSGLLGSTAPEHCSVFGKRCSLFGVVFGYRIVQFGVERSVRAVVQLSFMVCYVVCSCGRSTCCVRCYVRPYFVRCYVRGCMGSHVLFGLLFEAVVMFRKPGGAWIFFKNLNLHDLESLCWTEI